MSGALHVTTLGDGDRPVVFLHGLFGQGKNFTTIAKALLADDAGIRCLLVDLPNHGRSAWVDSLDQRQWADLVVDALREHLDGRPCVLIGHSLGGKVAMQVALRHPALVEAPVVVDISPVASDEVGRQFGGLVAAMDGLDLASLKSRAEAERELSDGIPDPVVRGFLMQNLRSDHRAPEGHQWRWQMNLALLGSQLAEIGSWQVDDARPYEGPVLWVAGQNSPYVQREHEAAMRALFPRVRKVTVKGAGHWVHSEQPEAFTSIVRAVLAG